MPKEPLTIQIDPSSELARVLAEADDEPVILDSNGVRFRVIRTSEDLWADYDPDAVLAALEAAAGTLSPEEGERIKELIYRGREEGTRPQSRRRAGQVPEFSSALQASAVHRPDHGSLRSHPRRPTPCR